jgi:hypothetical protein
VRPPDGPAEEAPARRLEPPIILPSGPLPI